jgi:hypothetical protein
MPRESICLELSGFLWKMSLRPRFLGVVHVLEFMSSDSVALNSPRLAMTPELGGLEPIEMGDTGVKGATAGATCEGKGEEPEPDPVIYVEATDDFEVTDDTETTTEQFQEQCANLYAMGFRLVIE